MKSKTSLPLSSDNLFRVYQSDKRLNSTEKKHYTCFKRHSKKNPNFQHFTGTTVTSRLWKKLSCMLQHGLLNRWTSQYDLGITTGGLTFNLDNGTKTHLIIIKLLENTFFGMKKVRAWPILTLAMPQVKTEQIQNLALFQVCCKRPKSVISENLSKNRHV